MLNGVTRGKRAASYKMYQHYSIRKTASCKTSKAELGDGLPSVKVAGNKRPLLKDLHNHVLLGVADKWRDLGVQLLAPDHQGVLKIIAADHPHDVVSCCKCVLEKWLDTTTDATWDQLITALRSPSIQLHYLASQLEQMLITKCHASDLSAVANGRNSNFDRPETNGTRLTAVPDDLWQGSRTSGFCPHRVTNVMSQESLKEKRKPKPSPHMLQFQETSFTKKPTSGSYTRHTGSVQNVWYPDHVGNSQYEGYDGRRSSISQSQSHYAFSGAIYPLNYSSRASELTLPPYRAGEAPPPYANNPIQPVNPPEMRRDSQSSDSDSSLSITMDNPIFQSPLYREHYYKAIKGTFPHPHSEPQINMYNADSVHGSHGSIGQGFNFNYMEYRHSYV